jgi:tRNA threonylcarbamoyladenosine biosynthesis protein TsaB
MILCLETATTICSVALCDREQVIMARESDKDKSHASSLTILIGEVLNKAAIRASDLDAVAVSKGPGSYTGLRIGVSTAKGISFASSVPLIGIDTTISMFYGFTGLIREKYSLNPGDLFCPVLDARRMEVYYSVINYEGKAVKSTRAEIITKDSFNDLPPESRIFLFGNGAEKCREVVTRGNIIFYDDFRLSASFMQIPAYEALMEKRFEDVAYFEPFYLKDFLTSLPVKNILSK